MRLKLISLHRTSIIIIATLAAAMPSGGVLALPAAGEAASDVVAVTEEPPPAPWAEVQRLVNEQKLQAARELVGSLREQAQAANDASEWTRALVEEVQLTTALHGYETAVRFLKDQEWPADPTSRAVLDLFYANALITYNRNYSWEIRSRERVASSAEPDLKEWTAEQIVAEAQRAFARVWSLRAEWGDASLGELARYISQNSYPARIRGTLRDAVSYLWMELLADTSLWRPEQSEQIYRLDRDALIAGDPQASVQLDLADPDLHPLVKIGAVLDDLEAWHLAGGRPEAAHEARLERLQRLYNAFTVDDDKLAVRRQLEQAQVAFDRSYEWWSVGQATLAQFLRSEKAPDALVRAREAAFAGLEQHPEGLGGERCRHIVAAIEAPDFGVEAMAVDGPGRRSILVRHRNLDAVHFRAYAVDLKAAVEKAQDANLIPGHREVDALVSTGTPVAEWTVELPETPDYRDHSTYDIPPLTTPGAYVLVASARSDFAQQNNRRVAHFHIVSDLVLLRRDFPDELEVTVRSGRVGAPIEGAELRLYRFDWRRGHQLVASELSAADGRVHFRTAGLERQQHFILAVKDAQVALDRSGVYPQRHMANQPHRMSLVYTDRSVYRPQQKLYWKVLAFTSPAEGFDYRSLPDAELTVTLRDANNEQVAETTVTTNDFGSASGSFDIPAGRLLGNWEVGSSLNASTSVKVEEYKRPTFELSILDPQAPLRLNRPATLHGEARYYFGLPVAEGKVVWRVSREAVYPVWWWWRPPPQAPQIIAAGETTLDADGRFSIEFTPEVDEREAAKPGMSYRYRLSAEATDAGGETRPASRAFRLGFVSVEAVIDRQTGFVRAGDAVELSIRRSDLNGGPRAGAGSWRLLRLVQPERAVLPADQPVDPATTDDGYHTVGDALRPRWASDYDPQRVMGAWDDGEELASGRLEHGDDGTADLSIADLAAGAYRLRYTTEDDFGATCAVASELLVVADAGNPVALPAVLLGESSSVAVGETARFFVRSGLRHQEMVLELYRNNERIWRLVLAAGFDDELIEVPVSEELRGGFALALSVLRDHQLMRQTSQVFVPWDNKELQLEVASLRDRLTPGGEESFSVTVRGPDDHTVARGAVELLAYMYDKSLDIFAPHNPPSVAALYPRLGYLPRFSDTLGPARMVWSSDADFVSIPGYPHLAGDHLKGIDGYGVGGPGRRGGPMGGVRMFKAGAAVARGDMPPSPAPAVAFDALSTSEEMDAVPEAEGEIVTAVQEVAEPPEEAPAGELRSDFAETAFFQPHLLSDDNGAVTVRFTVPDSVTEWNLWVHAVNRDLQAGTAHRQTRSVKELMVRPYLPRFLREGDRAELKVVVNNAGELPLDGTVNLEIYDPDSEEDLTAAFGLTSEDITNVPFTVAAGAGADLEFALTAPPRVGPVAFKVTAAADGFSDGELRPLPVLPGRMHLMQSRFAALSNADRRELRFADLAADDDPTRIDDQLVVTVDAQLFYSVLSALPYLVNYPYECTEQTLNRFLSTGILSSLYDAYPAVSSMADKLAERTTRLETWDSADPNRKMLLEETPWLVEAKGGDEPPEDLLNVLDPRVADAERRASIAKLEKAQTSLGAFPWWPGGPPSPFMTLYIVHGFSKALEFDVDVPKMMVVRAFEYLHRHYLDEWVERMMRNENCWESVTFLNYILSNFPDESWTGGLFSADERRRMLDFSFRHWKEHSPLLKGYLALTLEREGRHDDARLVFDAVMDSARTDPDLGTYWAPEDRAWLWYNDTIETHAFALRVLAELEPDDARRHGMVQWLLLNKKLNHWKSTRATAEVIYSLTHYLEREGALGIREDATVTVGDRRARFVFEPDEYTGKSNQLVIPGDEIDPAAMSTIVVEKQSKGFAFASATWHFSTERLPEEARGDFFNVERRYFRRRAQGDEFILEPLEEGAALAIGDQVEVQISIRAKHSAEYVHLRDPRGAGFEPESTSSGYRWDLGVVAYEEIRDSGTNFFFEQLPVGEYTLSYRLRATMAGRFKTGPATLQSMYAPEFAAYSAGNQLEIASE